MQIELRRYDRLSKSRSNDPITEEEVIQGLTYGNRVMSDMPKTFPSPGDKLNTIIAEKDKTMEEVSGGRDDFFSFKRKLLDDIHKIGEVVDKMDVAVKNLTPNQQYILKWFYQSGTSRKTWKDIAIDLKIYESKAKDDRKIAIEGMTKVLRITHKQFDFVVRKIGKEEKDVNAINHV